MKKRLGFIIGIVLIVVGCLVYFGYRYMTPKKVLIRTLHSYSDNVFKENTNKINTEKILSKDYKELDVNGNLSYTGQDMMFDIKYNQDDKNKISQIKYDLGIDKTKISGDLVSTNKKLYIMIKDAFKKYYYTDMDNEFMDDYINILKVDESIDLEKLVNLFIDSIDENLSNSYFVSSKETITLNDKKINTKKYTIKYTKKLNDKIIETFFKKVKKNNDASTTMSKLMNIDEKELDKKLNNYIEELKDGEDYSYNISVYTKLNKTILVEMGTDDSSIAVNKDKNVYNFIIKEGKNTAMTGKVDASNDKKIVMEAKFTDEAYPINMKCVVETTKSSSKEVTVKAITTISMMGENVSSEMNITIKKGEAINSDIIKDADKIENMTESEANAFTNLFSFDSLVG